MDVTTKLISMSYFITITPMKSLCFYIVKKKKSGVAAQDELVSPAHWRWKEREQQREEWRCYFALVDASRSESDLASLPIFWLPPHTDRGGNKILMPVPSPLVVYDDSITGCFSPA